MRKRAVRGGSRHGRAGGGGGCGGGARGRCVQVDIVEREDLVLQRMCVRTAGAPRAPPPHFAFFRENFLSVKSESADTHVSPAAVGYHELHCKTSSVTIHNP